jgi:hypothetical protein
MEGCLSVKSCREHIVFRTILAVVESSMAFVQS